MEITGMAPAGMVSGGVGPSAGSSFAEVPVSPKGVEGAGSEGPEAFPFPFQKLPHESGKRPPFLLSQTPLTAKAATSTALHTKKAKNRLEPFFSMRPTRTGSLGETNCF